VIVAWGLVGILLAPVLLIVWLGDKLGLYARIVWYNRIRSDGWDFMGLHVGDNYKGWEVTAIDEEYGPEGARAFIEFEKE